MQVQVFRPGQPPERTRFARRLRRLPAQHSAVALAQAVAQRVWPPGKNYNQTLDLGPLTVPPFQRQLLLQIGAEPVWIPPDAKRRDLKYFLRQFLALRSLDPVRQAGAPEEPLIVHVTRIFWSTYIEQELVTGNPKHDLARTWLMYEEVWPELLRAKTVTVRPGLIPTAIGAVHNALLFLVGMLNAGGHVQDPAAYFSETALVSQLSKLTSQLSTSLAELQPILRASLAPETRFKNVFAEYPLVSLDDGSLLAPDPAVLVNSFERAILMKLLRDYIHEDGQDGFDSISEAFGLVFEEYGRRIISAAEGLGAGLGGEFLPEFKYLHERQEVASPDAFVLRADRNLVFEFKATRYPFDVTNLATDPIGHLWTWVSKLLGATATRAPLRQGADFFDRAGQIPEVRHRDVGKGLYLICTYPRVPPILNLKRWRREALNDYNLIQPLFSRTAFVSIGDLEVAAAAASTGLTPALVDLVFEWWQTVSDYNNPLEALSLGDFILEQYSEVASAALPLLTTARGELFQSAKTAAFGEAMEMPKKWWLVHRAD